MIKPIVYYDIREKKKLEAKLFSKIPLEKRKAAFTELLLTFFPGWENRSPGEAAYAI